MEVRMSARSSDRSFWIWSTTQGCKLLVFCLRSRGGSSQSNTGTRRCAPNECGEKFGEIRPRIGRLLIPIVRTREFPTAKQNRQPTRTQSTQDKLERNQMAVRENKINPGSQIH
jgi:hypothetical protein